MTDHRGEMIRAIVRAENAFPATFAEVEPRRWGVMYVVLIGQRKVGAL